MRTNARRNEQGLALIELMMVVVITLIIGAVAVPSFLSMRRNFRTAGESRDIASEILVAKMRAASDFTQVRVRFNLTAGQHLTEFWNKTTNTWDVDAPTGTYTLPSGVSFGVGSASGPPSGTQATLGQAPACVPGSSVSPGAGTAISDTACVVFNSRGIPIDTSGAATANDAIYIDDGASVYGITLSATGQLQRWRIDFGDTAASHWTRP